MSSQARRDLRRNLDESGSSFQSIDTNDVEDTVLSNLERSGRGKQRKASEKENTDPQPSTSKMVRKPSTSRANTAPAGKKTRGRHDSSSSDINEESVRNRRPVPSPRRGANKSPQRRDPSGSRGQGGSSQRHQQSQQQQNESRPQGAKKRKNNFPVLRDIRKLQTNTNLLIPNSPFCRLVREIMQKHGRDLRITGEALTALREAAETYATGVLSDAYLITVNRKQVTLMPRDIHLLMLLRGHAMT